MLLNLHCQIQSGGGTISILSDIWESRGQEGRVFPGVPNLRPSKLESQGR